jgi:hypothetical protein
MKSAMNQAGRDHEKMTAAQIHRLRTRELVGRSTVEQKEQLKALMRVPRDAAGEVAADPADVDEHLQLDLVPKHVNRFLVHTSSTSWAAYCAGRSQLSSVTRYLLGDY